MNVITLINEQRQRPEYMQVQTDFMTECTTKYGKDFILKFLPAFNDFINQENTLYSYAEQLKEWGNKKGETMVMFFDNWAGFQVVEKLEEDGILIEDRMPEEMARAFVLKHIIG